jgi:hypothetical protein
MRNSAKAFFTFALLGLVGACAETSMAPATDAPAFVAPANYTRVGNVITFRVNNAEGVTKKLGSHLISIPAGAICALNSTYGPGTWDDACTPLSGGVTITATLLYDNDNQPYVDFQPALRFAKNKQVMLFLRTGRNSAGRQMIVQYCTNLGHCVDESLTDATLKPFRVGKTNIIGRRIKHFSGYNIFADRECQGGTVVSTPEGLWCEMGDGGMTRRSGYMVASGEDVNDVMKDKDEKEGKKDSH